MRYKLEPANMVVNSVYIKMFASLVIVSTAMFIHLRSYVVVISYFLQNITLIKNNMNIHHHHYPRFLEFPHLYIKQLYINTFFVTVSTTYFHLTIL